MKKRTFYLILFSVSLLFFTSCKSNSQLTIPTTSTETGILSFEKEISQETADTMSTTKALSEPPYVDKNQGGAIIEARKYRVRYYSIPGPFADLVGRQECYDWENEYAQNIILSNRMLIVYFVKAFNIPREDFEKANLQLAKALGKNNRLMMNPLDYTNQEIYEIFNADIIYTFDDQIINEYYLSHDYPYLYEHEYEEAVSNGTYQTRTTDWVDIEQMEAEIIAKYGEAEIVTEVTEITTIPEETTATDLAQIETNE